MKMAVRDFESSDNQTNTFAFVKLFLSGANLFRDNH